MKCDELKNLAHNGLLQAKLAEPELRAHLSECAECDALYGADARLSQVLVAGSAALNETGGEGFALPFADLEALRGEVNAHVADETRDPGNVLRDRPTSFRRAVVLTAVLVSLGLCVVWSPRADLPHYPLPRLVVELGLLFILVGAAIWEGTRPLTEPLRLSKRGVVLALCVAAPLVLALGSSFVPVSDTSDTTDLESIARCMSWGTAVALPVAFVLWFSKRKNPLEQARIPLLAATLGVVGNLLLQIHCPSSEFMHLLCAHVPLILVFALGLGLWGRIRASKVVV